jgi:hypothetical protein
LPAAAREFASGTARPVVMGVLALLVVPVIILTIHHSLYASGGNTITVNSLLDPGTTGDHLCGLREAIANANAKADTSNGDCMAGTGNDTIVFNLSGTIALVSGLPSIQHTLEIDGSGQTITVDGGGASRVFLNLAGSLTLNNLTIANGHSSADGGGVFNSGTLVVTNSTFVGNSGTIGGGAIVNSAAGTMAVTNCTFSGNVSASGGAIHSDHGGTVTNSTFAGNSAGTSAAGAAVLANNSTITVTNSILASSTGLSCGVSGSGVIGNGGDNISDDSSCGFGSSTGANGDTIGDGVNPLLDSGGLQNNGGPTDTIALQATSPAVNAVPIANCPPTDQRGDPRPDPGDKSNACDAGAFESIDAVGTPTPTVSATPTATTSGTPTATPTATGTATATSTASATDTTTATPTVTSTATSTATATATQSATATATDTATATGTATPTASATATLTATATDTTTATGTATATPTVTATPTETATATATVTATATDTATATATDTATPTATATATATFTATPTATSTPKPPPIKLSISPTSLNFGKVDAGNAPVKTVTLHNKSTITDMVTLPSVTGQYFSLASNTCAAGVPAGGSCQIGVSFTPLTSGKKFTGALTFTDQSKSSSHKVKLAGKGIVTGSATPTATPSMSPSPTMTPTATATATSTGGATPTATATATTLETPTPTATSTAMYTLSSISETVKGFVDLNNPGAVPNPVETMQAVAVSTPSFADSISLSDTNVEISGSASASQISQAEGSTISANESAETAADLSLCPGGSPLCTAENQGITDFNADFCIASDTNYSLTGSVQASANEDLGNITATGAVSLEALGPPTMFLVEEQATNGQNVPLSMSLPLTAGCYAIDVQVFADALPSGTGSGSASASCNVLLSPQ